jgi:hypothetical protein
MPLDGDFRYDPPSRAREAALAAQLEAKDRLIAELLEALKPFGNAALVVEEDTFPDAFPVHAARGPDGKHRYELQVRHFSRVLSALSKAKEQ